MIMNYNKMIILIVYLEKNIFLSEGMINLSQKYCRVYLYKRVRAQILMINARK